jgi:hypothetical protein
LKTVETQHGVQHTDPHNHLLINAFSVPHRREHNQKNEKQANDSAAMCRDGYTSSDKDNQAAGAWIAAALCEIVATQLAGRTAVCSPASISMTANKPCRHLKSYSR